MTAYPAPLAADGLPRRLPEGAPAPSRFPALPGSPARPSAGGRRRRPAGRARAKSGLHQAGELFAIVWHRYIAAAAQNCRDIFRQACRTAARRFPPEAPRRPELPSRDSPRRPELPSRTLPRPGRPGLFPRTPELRAGRTDGPDGAPRRRTGSRRPSSACETNIPAGESHRKSPDSQIAGAASRVTAEPRPPPFPQSPRTWKRPPDRPRAIRRTARRAGRGAAAAFFPRSFLI
jgi:hypothetical protein